ncbi:MAG: SpoIID/LytB domain-containing protein [Deltaproteobacteria bacterium]|nr:SpoIID/LytB domain-containing protein [Deltaproteobacteria bacterium]
MLRAGLCLALLALAPAAAADPLSRTDRVRLLYSNQFQFGTGGDPVVTVGLMQHQDSVRLGSQGPLRLMPDGEGGVEISLPAGSEVSVDLEDGDGGALDYWAIVEHVEGAAADQADAVLARWRERGFPDARTIETGTVFGVVGRVLDSRDLLVGVRASSSRADAERLVSDLARRYTLSTTGVQPLVRRPPSGRLIARWSVDGARSSAVVRTSDVLWIASDGRHPIRVRDVEHGVGYSWHGREDRTFAGRIYVVVDRSGKLTVANAVPLDRLLAGIVPSEIYADSPDGALRAQAVTARGELMAKIGHRHLLDPFLVCAEQHCQVYGGLGRERERATAAVLATRGEVLFRPGSATLVGSVYHAACGGFTEDNDVVWPSRADPQLRGHLDADVARHPELERFAAGLRTDALLRQWLALSPPTYCSTGRFARAAQMRWSTTMEAAEVDRLVNARHPVGRVLDLEPDGRGASGRLHALSIRGDRGTARVERELAIRQLFGNLKSASFVVDIERASNGNPLRFTFRGAGWGHGVGMCQTGAMSMAERGTTYRQILAHYFPGADLGRLY